MGYNLKLITHDASVDANAPNQPLTISVNGPYGIAYTDRWEPERDANVSFPRRESHAVGNKTYVATESLSLSFFFLV